MNQTACTTADDNFGNTAMLTDGSGVPQVLYQYDLRTGLFTSINANNIRNPFTSLGEAGAITDSLTLTTNVDWTVYRGGVSIDTNIISMLESSVKKTLCNVTKLYLLPESQIGWGTGFSCLCWNGKFDRSQRQKLHEEIKQSGVPESYISGIIDSMENEMNRCCFLGGKGLDVGIVKKYNDEDKIVGDAICQLGSGESLFESLITII